MTIDVSEILKEFGGKTEVSGTVTINDVTFRGESYTFDKPLGIEGIMVNNGKALVLTADVEAQMHTQCARCLKDIVVDAGFSMEEHFVQSDEETPTDDDTIAFEGYTVDIDDAVRDNLIMSIKGRYLCSEDCKGLCQQCGADLNNGECGCNNEYIDPRWAGLADLINKNK